MNRSQLISIVLTGVTLLWLMSGALGEQQGRDLSKANKLNLEEGRELFRVQARDVVSERVTKEVHLQGQIKAIRDIELKVESDGRVVDRIAYQGKRVNQGEAILQLGLKDKRAKLQRAKAELDLRRAEHTANHTLRRQKLISETHFLQSQARFSMAKASVKEMEIELNNTTVNAPFSGIVNALSVEKGTYLRAGETIGSLVDDSAALISADVPQQFRDKLKLDMELEASLLDGTTIKGRISYLSNEADPNTRTYRLEAKLEGGNVLEFFGQSAAIVVPFEKVTAHRISPSLLELDTHGKLQVKTINMTNEVTVFPVEIVRSQLDSLWVSGLPDSVRLITIGQGFVSPGQEVDPVFTQKS